MRPAPPSECPVCGADLPPRARACPECGADERTGWNEDDSRYDGLDLPDSAFDDHDQPRSAHGSADSPAKRLLWPAVGLLLVILLVYGLIAGR
jgi:hypothetical protein